MIILGKKKEIECACNGEVSNSCCEGLYDENCCKSIQSVKVLGSGCKSCHTLFDEAKEAIQSLKLDVDVEYITDMEKIVEYGVMSMPALVVNENVISMGKVLKASDIMKLFGRLGY